VKFLGEFCYGVYDIDIHELNLGPFKDLKFWDEISFKNGVFFAFLNNECIIIINLKEKTTTISNKRFYKWALHYFFNFLLFGNVS
jgi:hypothetical protein